MRELEKVLDKKEKVLWEGKPEFTPYFIPRLAYASTIALFISIAFSILLLYFWMEKSTATAIIATTAYLLISLVLPITAAIIIVTLNYQNTHYAITDKRVIIQQGMIGRDFRVTDFDQITSAEVNIGISDKFFGKDTGTISIIVPTPVLGQTKYGPIVAPPTQLSNIRQPYEVFKFFKKLAHDVKADMQYPNKYRPSENTGYNTRYKPKTKAEKKGMKSNAKD